MPWRSVWSSPAVWAIIVAHTCSNWGWYMLLVKLPTYMHAILKFDIASVRGDTRGTAMDTMLSTLC